MQEVLSHRPKTIMELYRMLPEGTPAEIIEGALYMAAAPHNYHQEISMNLSIEIGGHLKKTKLGKAFAAPCDVYLDNHTNVVQPDLVIVLRENYSIISNHIYGVPDMVIEILSDGNPHHDMIRKKALYERFGIKEYWIIEPSTREAVGFELKNGVYTEFTRSQGKITSNLLKREFVFVDEG